MHEPNAVVRLAPAVATVPATTSSAASGTVG
jgi:hypothetical protein